MIKESKQNVWIPKELRYRAGVFCTICNRKTTHEEVVRKRWRCSNCKKAMYFEDGESVIPGELPRKRKYKYNRKHMRWEPKRYNGVIHEEGVQVQFTGQKQ